MDKILNERIYKAINAGGDREEAEILFRLDEMTADQRRNLNYSISRAQYNTVTEVHMHTVEGGLSYTLPFSAFRGGMHKVSIPGKASNYAFLYKFKHPFIYTSLSMESYPYEQSAQYLGKPYNELKQGDVRSALQEKWTHVDQDEYDVSSIDGSTFKRENIINNRGIDYKKFSIQIRENVNTATIFLGVLGIILGFMAIDVGLVFPLLYKF